MSTLLHATDISIHVADQCLCRDFNVTIKSGEMWGILGPNGSGKTSLLHTLGGLKSHSTGEILIQKRPINDYDKKTVARLRGFLFQEYTDCFPDTVWNYCAAGLYPHQNFFSVTNEIDNNKINAALTLMGLEAHAAQSIETLSGGERRRLSIATLLIQNPLIYLLDEPTNHVDLHFQMQLFNYLKTTIQLNKAAAILSLHDINLAAHYCDKLIVLFGDGTYEIGTPDTLLTSALLSRLYAYPIKKIGTHPNYFWCVDLKK